MRLCRFLLAGCLASACSGSGGQPDATVLVGLDAVDDPCGGAGLACNLLTQTGCNPGDKCTWVRVSAECGGGPGCVPGGDVPVGGSCTWGPDGALTGYDDCVVGAVCDDIAGPGVCVRTCSLADATLPCPGGFACAPREGLFSNGPEDTPLAGVCDPTCDPLTQTRLSDGAPACGSTTMPPDRGCYGLPSSTGAPTEFHCMPAGTGGHGTMPPPPVRVNSCAPGAVPLLLGICTAFCDPLTINNTTPPENRFGQSPYSCPEVGATGATERCQHLWASEGASTPITTASNAYGFCIDFALFTWDDDQNAATPPVAWPLPETLTPYVDPMNVQPTEDLYWGTAPYPSL